MTEIKKILVDLQCDICGAPMTMTKVEGGVGFFECTKCEQVHDWDASGHGVKILKNIFPSMPLKEMSAEMQKDFVDAWRDKKLFDVKALYLLGLTSNQQYNEAIKKISETYNGFFLNDWKGIKKQSIKRHWWQRKKERETNDRKKGI